MKTILVCGASGFVGRSLTQHLIRKGYRVIPVTSKEIDLTKPQSVDQLNAFKADYIFHAAGKVGVMSSWSDPTEFYQRNRNTTEHLLEYARRSATPLHYISGYIYGNQVKQPIAESALPLPSNPYAHSKLQAEELCKFYYESCAVPITISRPFNIYGERQSKGFFIPEILDQILHQEKITINDGSPKRDFIYIDDVADALIAIMERGKNGAIYNIGTGISHSCSELISLVQSILQTDKEVIVRGVTRPEEIVEAYADITKIQSDTGWVPKYSLREGLYNIILFKCCL